MRRGRAVRQVPIPAAPHQQKSTCLDFNQFPARGNVVSGGVFFQRESAMHQPSISKSMTTGESGLALVFAVTTFLCVVASAKAVDAPFAFHAALSAAASLAAVFFIINRYFDRPAALPPDRSS